MSKKLNHKWLLRLAELESQCSSISVAGLAVDLGLYKENKMENLLTVLKAQILSAMRAKDVVARDVLRVVVGEVEALQNTTNQGAKPVSDEQIHNIIRKIIESNNLNLSKTDIISSELTVKLNEENRILTALVPVLLTVEEIIVLLNPIVDEIKNAGKASQAMGPAMKLLKTQKDPVTGKPLPVTGKNVELAIAQIRPVVE